MAIIKVPKPPQSAFNKNRPLSTLLKSQVEHLQEAELLLPARDQTNIYINAIKTEGEAAEYIRRVTTKIHDLHGAPVGGTAGKTKPTRRRGLSLAAVAKPARKRNKKAKTPAKRRKSTS